MNLDNLPSIEDAQTILSSIETWANENGSSVWWNLPSGMGSAWLDLNAEWGLKIFFRDGWGSGVDGTIQNAMDAYEIGIGPYIHPLKHLIKIDGKICPCVFMQRVPVVLDNDEYDFEYDDDSNTDYYYDDEVDDFVKYCGEFGFYDLIPSNLGVLDGNLVMVDSSHRRAGF